MSVAPTLPTACGSLPPEGALRLRSGEASPAAPAWMTGKTGMADVAGFFWFVLLVYKRYEHEATD